VRAAIPDRHGEGEKVPVQILQRGGVLTFAERGATKQLARPGNLTQAPPPPRIFERQVDELERPIEGSLHEAGVARPPTDHPSNLTPDIGQLFHERQLSPASRGQLAVSMGGFSHAPTSLSTMSRIDR